MSPLPSVPTGTLGLILMVAMSATWSTSCTTASYISPLASFTRTRRRFATTCALVTISPSGDTRKPEPLEMGTSRPRKGCLQGGQGSGGVGGSKEGAQAAARWGNPSLSQQSEQTEESAQMQQESRARAQPQRYNPTRNRSTQEQEGL